MLAMVVQSVVYKESGGHNGGDVEYPLFEIDTFRAVFSAGFCSRSFLQHAPGEVIPFSNGGSDLYKGEGRRAGKVQRDDGGAGIE